MQYIHTFIDYLIFIIYWIVMNVIFKLQLTTSFEARSIIQNKNEYLSEFYGWFNPMSAPAHIVSINILKYISMDSAAKGGKSILYQR